MTRKCAWCGDKFDSQDDLYMTCSLDCAKARAHRFEKDYQQTRSRARNQRDYYTPSHPKQLHGAIDLVERCGRCGMIDCNRSHSKGKGSAYEPGDRWGIVVMAGLGDRRRDLWDSRPTCSLTWAKRKGCDY